MFLKKLDLKNIGPFRNESITFIKDQDHLSSPPVTIITGENGSGKTIILDSIRALFAGVNPPNGQGVERKIYSNPTDFYLSLDYLIEEGNRTVSSNSYSPGNQYWLQTEDYQITNQFKNNSSFKPTWIFDYWTSKLATDSFHVSSLTAANPNGYLSRALTGAHQNTEVSQLICFFDYLKSSDAKDEKELGLALFEYLKKIIKVSLNNGEFSHVARTTLEPIIKQNGKEITLDKLSSGNLYLIQRLVSLLGQAFAVYSLNKGTDQQIALKDITDIKGVLLIDEAENHLHPKWQKTFLTNLLTIFPRLQIIVTTHSPFIVSSVTNANIYVCDSKDDHSVIVDETDFYSSKSIGEILTTDLFKTEPFAQEITLLIEERKRAILNGDRKKAKTLEKKLVQANPQYFSFFEIDEIINKIKGK
jgi:predicted ATP-binding protein involved in virulence